MKLNIGRALVHFRELRGMSQIDLAEATGIRQPTISLYESDKRVPSPENLRKITEALDVDSDDIENYVYGGIESVQEISRVSRSQHYQMAEFYVTDDISVGITAVVRDHSTRRHLRNNVLATMVEKAVLDYIERNYDGVDAAITEELSANKDEIERFLARLQNKGY